MRSLTFPILAAGLLTLTGCTTYTPIFVDANAVCRDAWYGYWRTTCQPAPAPYSVAEAERDIVDVKGQLQSLRNELAPVKQVAAAEHDIADVKGQIQSLRNELAAAKQVIATLGENQTHLRNQLNLVKAEKDLLKALQPEIAKGTVMVKQAGEGLAINLNSSLLFAPGHDQLLAGGKDALKRVGAVLKDFPTGHVHVAGYTDSVPIRGELQKKFPSNKELSDARAHHAVEALQAGGLTSQVSAEGHGDSNPVASNTTVEGRAKNRRVELQVSL